MPRKSQAVNLSITQAVLRETLTLLRLHFELDHGETHPAIAKVDTLRDALDGAIDMRGVDAVMEEAEALPALPGPIE